MKAIILAGGLGTRISEETYDKPKPMVTLNGKPILWHLMNILSEGGISDFIVAAGYKAEAISDWVKHSGCEWNVDVVNSGIKTQTGGRLKFCMEKYPDESIIATYGDGLANVNIAELIEFHKKNRRLATVTAVRPPARFGVLEFENGIVSHFGEKQHAQGGWINGGFFICDKQILGLISSLTEPFEGHPISTLVAGKGLGVYQHRGWWHPMDTLRDKRQLEEIWQTGNAPWVK